MKDRVRVFFNTRTEAHRNNSTRSERERVALDEQDYVLHEDPDELGYWVERRAERELMDYLREAHVVSEDNDYLHLMLPDGSLVKLAK